MGKAEVPEGVRTVAARHRGKSTRWYQDNGLVNNVILVKIYTKIAKLCFQEEYEDSSGNVVNKKTYEDLKRQGLL